MDEALYSLTIIGILVVMVIGIVIQSRLRSTFAKYNSVRAKSGHNTVDMATKLIYDKSLDVSLTQTAGELTDHFDPKNRTVALSQSVYGNDSLAALAVAAHEFGHVMQYKEEYTPIKVRNAIVPIASFSSKAAPFVILGGFLFSSVNLIMIGVYLYAAILAFQLVTLPVEFNASSRAIKLLTDGGYIDSSEVPAAKKVLKYAAMTYVIATLSTLLTLLRFILIASSGRRRR